MRKKSSGITELEALVINKRFKMNPQMKDCRKAVQNYMTHHLGCRAAMA
jgi:hypothetical protein